MIENLELAREIISKRFEKEDKNYGLYVLGCYGLLSKFKDDYQFLVENVFLDTNFYIDDKNLVDLLHDGGIEPEETYDYNTMAENNLITATSFQGDFLCFDEYGYVLHDKEEPKLFCTTKNKTNNEILNALIHEAAHLVKGSVNYIRKRQKDCFSIRTGLNTSGYYIDNGKIKHLENNTILDETINVLQTSDMMREIKKLNKDTLTKEELLFYDKLNIESLDDTVGYSQTVELIKPLWENEYFKNNIEENIVLGNINKIKHNFNETIGYPLFQHLSKYLDIIDENYDNNKIIEGTSMVVNHIIKLYCIKNQSNKIPTEKIHKKNV